METITFENLYISGIEYNKLCSLTIVQNINDHGEASFVCEMPFDKAKEYVCRASENTILKIKTSASGQHKTLFCGVVVHVALDGTGGYGLVSVKLKSTSHILDLTPKNRTFQNTNASFGEVMTQSLVGRGSVQLSVTDSPIGNVIIRYQETDWQFIKRMASQLNSAIIANVNTSSPTVQVGVPKGNVIPIEREERLEGASGDRETMGLNAIEYAHVGETVSYQGSQYIVSKARSEMLCGRLITSYAIGQNSKFEVAPIYNAKSSGRMFLGEVKEVKKDKVRVNFTQLDKEYDSGGSHWFPYSTAYASGDGSGLYLMPEEGDMVRVFMPSDNEKDAFAASSVNTNPLPNPKDKSWKVPSGKEILLTEDGLYIICEKEKIFINLTKNDGIEITSNKKIEISSDEGVVINSSKNITMSAKKQITMGVGNSSVLIDKEQISMTGNQVYVN